MEPTPLTEHGTNPAPLRFVFFGASVVSDWGNPAATTTRAVIRALAAVGHDAVFLEERGNRPTVELLRARGAGPLRAYAARYPDVLYRTYDVPHGAERSVWPGRELSTADAVVVQDTAPPDVIEKVARLTTPRLVRFYQATSDDVPAVAASYDYTLSSSAGEAAPSVASVPFGPAVAPADCKDQRSPTCLVVAYDNGFSHSDISLLQGEPDVDLVVASGAELPGARFVPEVDLEPLYCGASAALIISGDPSPLAAARFLLPLAHGCRTLANTGGTAPPLPRDIGVDLVPPDASSGDVLSLLRQPHGDASVPSVPDRYSGASHAATLVRLVVDALRERRK